MQIAIKFTYIIIVSEGIKGTKKETNFGERGVHDMNCSILLKICKNITNDPMNKSRL